MSGMVNVMYERKSLQYFLKKVWLDSFGLLFPEDSCIVLMHLEILKLLLEWPYLSLELSRKKYKCLVCCLCHKSCG